MCAADPHPSTSGHYLTGKPDAELQPPGPVGHLDGPACASTMPRASPSPSPAPPELLPCGVRAPLPGNAT